jgi:hypothetical protein
MPYPSLYKPYHSFLSPLNRRAQCARASPRTRSLSRQSPSAPCAWKETDHERALEQLTRLAIKLDREHPGAAASLREGIEETLTVIRLGIDGKLKLTLQSTNPCESMISTVRVIQRNVKNWSSGEMCMRWTAAGMLEAESRFRKVPGYRGLAQLAVAIERDLIRHRHTTRMPPSQSLCNHHTRTAATKDPRRQRTPPAACTAACPSDVCQQASQALAGSPR